MCGRFALSYPYFQKLLAELGVTVKDHDSFEPHFNIAPGQQHWMFYKQNGSLMAEKATWGFTPSWMKSGQLLFNAKIETALEKPTFKRAYSLHRCVIPINGFYEWVKQGGIKQPHFFHRMNDEVFFLAGIYYMMGSDKAFVVITTAANGWMQPFHHRMPIILTGKNYQDWLSTKALMEQESFVQMETLLEQRKVSTKVNSARIDDPSCILPID